MNDSTALQSERFPRASRYHPDWILAGVSGGAHSLRLAEWLTEALPLRPGMRVLDLGCGRGQSAVFLHREFGVQVWAADLWFSPTETWRRAQDAGAHDGVFPLRVDARSLPFAEEFFDAIVAIDSYPYYGTDEFYLSYLTQFLKPGGRLGIAQVGLTEELPRPLPEQLVEWWETDNPCGLHTAAWWRRHWEQSRMVDVEVADPLTDGWRYWLDWLRLVAPDNQLEQRTLATDAGRHLGYVRVVATRRPDARIFDPHLTIPANYESRPLLRE